MFRSILVGVGSWLLAAPMFAQTVGRPATTTPTPAISSATNILGNMNAASAARNSPTRTMLGGSSRTGLGSGATTPGSTARGTPEPLQGQDWLIRRNRGRGSFVGADSKDAVGFVGSEQAAEAAGAMRTAISALRLKSAAQNNPPLAARRKDDLYSPRLEVGFDYRTPEPVAVNSALAHHLQSAGSIRWIRPPEVSVEAGTATLRGAVASERDRALAAQMLSFEPGIVAVKNQLQVSSPAGSPSATPR